MDEFDSYIMKPPAGSDLAGGFVYSAHSVGLQLFRMSPSVEIQDDLFILGLLTGGMDEISP